MKTVTAMVAEFSQVTGGPQHNDPNLWWTLLNEELMELGEAAEGDDLVAKAKEAADVVYLLHGWMRVLGVDLSAVIEEVHQSNMTKVGGPVREDGKVMKGPNYVPPNLKPIIAWGVL